MRDLCYRVKVRSSLNPCHYLSAVSDWTRTGLGLDWGWTGDLLICWCQINCGCGFLHNNLSLKNSNVTGIAITKTNTK